ncbi:MAG TPA: hypothetical protein VIM77_13725, partial [Mucilaginibacter sp.]
MKTGYLLTLAVLLQGTAAIAQTDTITAVNNKLLTGKLKEGTSVYLIYDSTLVRTSAADLWERTTTFTTTNGQPTVEFGWKWYHNDSLQRKVTNICNRQTLAPLFHKTVFKTGTFAYDFKDSFMTPSDTVQNNAAMK